MWYQTISNIANKAIRGPECSAEIGAVTFLNVGEIWHHCMHVELCIEVCVYFGGQYNLNAYLAEIRCYSTCVLKMTKFNLTLTFVQGQSWYVHRIFHIRCPISGQYIWNAYLKKDYIYPKQTATRWLKGRRCSIWYISYGPRSKVNIRWIIHLRVSSWWSKPLETHITQIYYIRDVIDRPIPHINYIKIPNFHGSKQ